MGESCACGARAAPRFMDDCERATSHTAGRAARDNAFCLAPPQTTRQAPRRSRGMLCDAGSPSGVRRDPSALMESLDAVSAGRQQFDRSDTTHSILDTRWSLQFKDSGEALHPLRNSAWFDRPLVHGQDPSVVLLLGLVLHCSIKKWCARKMFVAPAHTLAIPFLPPTTVGRCRGMPSRRTYISFWESH